MTERFDESRLHADFAGRTFEHAPVLPYPFPVRHIPDIPDFGQANRPSLVRLRVVCIEEEDVEAQEFIERALETCDGIAFDLRDHAISEFFDEIGRRRQRIPAVFVGTETEALADHPAVPN